MIRLALSHKKLVYWIILYSPFNIVYCLGCTVNMFWVQTIASYHTVSNTPCKIISSRRSVGSYIVWHIHSIARFQTNHLCHLSRVFSINNTPMYCVRYSPIEYSVSRIHLEFGKIFGFFRSSNMKAKIRRKPGQGTIKRSKCAMEWKLDEKVELYWSCVFDISRKQFNGWWKHCRRETENGFQLIVQISTSSIFLINLKSKIFFKSCSPIFLAFQ